MNKIAVLGLGQSLDLFYPGEFDYTIGVNDIWGRVKTNAVVCLDSKSRFTPGRAKIIENCRPEIFYSQIINWDTHPGFKLIKLSKTYPEQSCNLNGPEINKSLCSPFVACGIAYQLHAATEIHVFGVDFLNHQNLKTMALIRIKTHFKNLSRALLNKGCELIIYGDGILVNN